MQRGGYLAGQQGRLVQRAGQSLYVAKLVFATPSLPCPKPDRDGVRLIRRRGVGCPVDTAASGRRQRADLLVCGDEGQCARVQSRHTYQRHLVGY